MSDVHPAALPIETLLSRSTFSQLRRSGPGGQRRNKVETGVRLTYDPTGTTVEATERRHLKENRAAAVRRLRLALAIEVRHLPDDDHQPSAEWRAHCRDQRITISQKHENLPTVLAEALDLVVSHSGDVRVAAKTLDCTPSQLVRLLKLAPPALSLVNRIRREEKLRPLT